MGYYEGDLCLTNSGCNNGNGSFGNNGDWIWAILLLALLGRNGIGDNGGGNGGGFYPYPFAFGGACGSSCATQADLAAGFNNSAVLSSLNDIKLGQAQAINYNNQGFAGLNTALANGFAGVDNAICTLGYNIQAGFNGVDRAVCTLGYQNQAGFNSIANQIASCCCDLKTMNLENRYLNERQTCDLINVSNQNTRAILDYLTGEKISSLQAENSGLKAQISNDRQSAFIIDALAPKCPQPAYVVQPPQQVTFPTNCCGNVAYASYGNNGGCGCGCN